MLRSGCTNDEKSGYAGPTISDSGTPFSIRRFCSARKSNKRPSRGQVAGTFLAKVEYIGWLMSCLDSSRYPRFGRGMIGLARVMCESAGNAGPSRRAI